MPNLQSHWLATLFEDMADQTHGARHHSKTTAYLPRQPEFAADRSNGTGGIDRQIALLGLLSLFRDKLHELDIGAAETVRARNRKKTRDPWIDRLVDGMANARNTAP